MSYNYLHFQTHRSTEIFYAIWKSLAVCFERWGEKQITKKQQQQKKNTTQQKTNKQISSLKQVNC